MEVLQILKKDLNSVYARDTFEFCCVKLVYLFELFFSMLKNITVSYFLFLDGIAVPTGVFVDSSHNVYVSEYTNYRITKWTPDNTTTGAVVAGGNGLSVNLNSFQTSGFYVGLLGEIYVPDLRK